MKIEVSDYVSTDLQGQALDIELNSIVFDALINKGYKDKISTAIRELSTNANDSHILAKQDKPFDVHLPTDTEQFFSIRDYGVGLCEDDIYKLYTRIGASNKRQSNDFTGCIGIGALSPYAYATQHSKNFTTTSYFDGEKKVYNCYLDDQNIPRVAKIHEEPTNEPNGIHVKFAVKYSDINSFRSKACQIYQYFHQKPNLNTELKFDDTNYNSINGHLLNTEKNGVWMGNVFYPIGVDDIDFSDENLNQLLQTRITFVAPLGSVDFTPFRESLEYTNKTKNYLKRMSREIVNECYKQVKTELDKIDSKWDLVKKVLTYSGLQRLGANKYLAAKNINTHFDLPNQINSFVYDYGSRGWKRKPVERHTKTVDISSVILFKDVGRGVKSKAKDLCRRHQKRICIIEDEGTLKYLGLTKDHENVVLASSLDDVKTKQASKKTTQVMKYTGYARQTDAWSNVEIDLDEGGIYIPTFSLKIRKNGRSVDFFDFKQVWKNLSDKERGRTYAARAKTLSDMENRSNWTCIWDIVDKHKQRLEKKGIHKIEEPTLREAKFPYMLAIDADHDISERAKKVLDDYKTHEKIYKKHEKEVQLYHTIIDVLCGTKSSQKEKEYDVTFLCELGEEFPLLNRLGVYSSAKKQEIIDYIERK